MTRIRLGVNIDHVATVRNARGGIHPDPVRAALIAEQAGADGITAHLREDRRHIRDSDMQRLKEQIQVPLNFEMAATTEMRDIALRVKPHACCLVPEKREERTTEGGLDVIGHFEALKPYVASLQDHDIKVSLFIEPDVRALDVAVMLKTPIVELHTGTWCHAVADHGIDSPEANQAFRRLSQAAHESRARGLEVHAGHGLDYITAQKLAFVTEFTEFNIGHFLMGEAIFTGLQSAIHTMRQCMERGRNGIASSE
jgi:pyridoxine 5-phosphate synthase